MIGPRETIVVHPVLLADQWKPLNLEEKKRYDREFLLGFQFIFASLQKLRVRREERSCSPQRAPLF